MSETIVEVYPLIVDTGEYIRFICPTCGYWNGSTVHLDGTTEVVVCGNCWAKHDVSGLEEVGRGPNP